MRKYKAAETHHRRHIGLTGYDCCLMTQPTKGTGETPALTCGGPGWSPRPTILATGLSLAVVYGHPSELGRGHPTKAQH